MIPDMRRLIAITETLKKGGQVWGDMPSRGNDDIDLPGAQCPFPRSACQEQVYHGTSNVRFKRFREKSGLGGAMGFWFASTQEAADVFTKSLYGSWRPAVDPGIKTCWLNIERPMEYNKHGAFLAAASVFNKQTNGEDVKALRRKLIREGYDGVVIRNSDTDEGGVRDDWVAFYPAQIKVVG